MLYSRIIPLLGLALAATLQACSPSSSSAIVQSPSSSPSPQATSQNISPTNSPDQSQANPQINPETNSQSKFVNAPAAIATEVNPEVEAISPQSQANLPQSCAIDRHTEFFENFVRGQDYQGNEMRYRFTAAYVQVRDYQDPSRLIEVMSRKNDEFSISLRDYRWVQLVPSQGSPYTRLNLEIKKVSDRMFRVDYIKAEFAYVGGESEGERLVRTEGAPNAYIFEHRNGCWYLTQKLQFRN